MQRSRSHTPSRSNTATSDTTSQRSAGSNSNKNVNSNSNTNNTSSSTDNRGESQQPQHHQAHSQQKQPLEWTLGLHIQVKTLTDEVYTGQIYAYDTKTNCVVLQCPLASTSTLPTSGANQKYDFRILKISFLKEVTRLPSRKLSTESSNGVANNSTTGVNGQNASNNTSVFATTLPAVGFVQIDRIQARDMQAFKETQVALSKIGVGVTPEAQEIFDALSKTMPCRWVKQSIVVLDEVRIDSPYNLENCKANSNSVNALERVRRVLEGVKDKLASGRKPQEQLQ